MIELYKKVDVKTRPKFSMPLSLRLIKECSAANIDWRGIHIIDLISIIYSLRIDSANDYLFQRNQQRMQEQGIASIRPATQEDFDSL